MDIIIVFNWDLYSLFWNDRRWKNKYSYCTVIMSAKNFTNQVENEIYIYIYITNDISRLKMYHSKFMITNCKIWYEIKYFDWLYWPLWWRWPRGAPWCRRTAPWWRSAADLRRTQPCSARSRSPSTGWTGSSCWLGLVSLSDTGRYGSTDWRDQVSLSDIGR